MVTALTSADEYKSCVSCPGKHNHTHLPFCQCTHCSISLCLGCMKEHHDEVLQDVAQFSLQYHLLKQRIQTKQKMIVDETAKSIDDVNKYFDAYIDELRETQQKIIANLETVKQDALSYIMKVDSDLHTLGNDIQALAKEGIVQTSKMRHQSRKLKTIEQLLNTYQVTSTQTLIKEKPEFSMSFEHSSVPIEIPHSSDIEINRLCHTNVKEPPFETIASNLSQQYTVMQEFSTHQSETNIHILDEDSWITGKDDSKVTYRRITTSYNVDRMASDGKNILYTSYYDDGPDRIAYYIMDDDGVDRYRDWNRSRIEDMIWWDSIQKFICATSDAIYTVEYANGRFKITCVIRDIWAYIRIAANTHEFFIWINSTENGFNGMQLYSTRFEHVKTIDFDSFRDGSFVGGNYSFWVTENVIALICTRMQNNRQVFQVDFCDLITDKLHSIDLGECGDNIEIRTDGNDLFFITTGWRRFHIVPLDGNKQTINLQNDGERIAVLDNRRIAISNGCSNIELITY